MFIGLTRGLQLLADFLSMRFRAERDANFDCVKALDQVAATWFSELTGSMIGLKGVSIKLDIRNFIFGADPFKGSRQAFQAVKLLFPGV